MARETDPLIGSAHRHSSSSSSSHPSPRDSPASTSFPSAAAATGAQISKWCNRGILLVLFVMLITASIAFNFRLRALSSRISADDAAIASLKSTVDEQAEVVRRFADSVSNADVLRRVSELENQLNATSRNMEDRLAETEGQIEMVLNRTLIEMDNIVNNAQTQIHEEVDRVKTDVDEYVRTTQDQFSMENSFMVYQLAGTFTLLACLISMWHITAHLRKFREPFVQRKILAILWMSPLYGITSWLSLVFPQFEGYLAVVKDFYEAYVIYQFLSFLIAVLGRGDRGAVVDLLADHADHLEPPIRICGKCFPKKYESNREMANDVLLQCQSFAMQFVFCRPLTTIGIFVCNNVEYFGRGESATDYRSPQFWFTMVQNVSVFVAFSGLLKFYHAVQDDLAWCRPFPKFLCIKGIVFMTFWQGLVIAILAKTSEKAPAPGMENESADDDPDIWAKQAQNFLICLEMLLFSIAHFYCFPTDEWDPAYRPKKDSDTKFGDNIALRDFFSDLKLILNQGSNKQKKRKSKMEKEAEECPIVDEIDDCQTEADKSMHSEASDGGNSLSPQMKMAAARLLASLNFEEFDNGDLKGDEALEDGMAGLMERIARSNDADSESGDDKIERGARGDSIGEVGVYGAVANALYDGDSSPWEANMNNTGSDEIDAAELGYGGVVSDGDDNLGRPDAAETSDNREEDNEECAHTANDHLLRPSIFTNLGSIKKK